MTARSTKEPLMISGNRLWRWQSVWLPAFFLVTVAGSVYGHDDRLWTSIRAALVIYMLWRIIDNNGRAFEKIHTSRDELLQTMQGTRIAAESLASTLDIIRAELSRNTKITAAGAYAGAEAAKLALDTAAKLASSVVTQRDALAVALITDREAAAASRDEIKVAVQNVGIAAEAAYKTANAVNEKISNLNERLIYEETKRDDPAPSEKP